MVTGIKKKLYLSKFSNKNNTYMKFKAFMATNVHIVIFPGYGTMETGRRMIHSYAGSHLYEHAV